MLEMPQQISLNMVTQDLLATREKLTKAEISCQTLTSEKCMLMESEKRMQAQYKNLLREQKSLMKSEKHTHTHKK